MMRLIRNGEPYVYQHNYAGLETPGDILNREQTRNFLIETLYESFKFCNSNIIKIADNWTFAKFKELGEMKKQPDLIYRMDGDTRDTWFYVFSSIKDKAIIDMDYVKEAIKDDNVLPVMIIGDMWCFDTNGERNICGGSYATKYETLSLLEEKNHPLAQILNQKELVEKIALSWNNLDVNILEPYLDKDFHYSSDAVFYEMSSSKEYIHYLRGKFEKLKDGSNPIGVQIGRMQDTGDFALLLHQGAYNQTLLITIQSQQGRIVSMRMSEYQR